MADQDGVGAVRVQRAVGLVGQRERPEGDAAVEQERGLAAELHGLAPLLRRLLRVVCRRPGPIDPGVVHPHRPNPWSLKPSAKLSPARRTRKRDGQGKSESVRVYLGGPRTIKKKNKCNN